MSPHGRWAYLAAAWALLFAAPHIYWATGATHGLDTALSTETIRNPPINLSLLNGIIAVICLCGAGVALATTLRWPPRWQRLARAVLIAAVWCGGGVLTIRTLNIYVAFTVELTGRVPAGDRAENFLAMARWFMFLWLPWFALGALVWSRLALTFTHHCREAVPHRGT